MDISMNIKYVKSGVKSKNQGKNHIQSKRMILQKHAKIRVNQSEYANNRLNKPY